MIEFSDGDLVVQARDGSREAFAVLYRRHFDGVYDFIVRMTRDRMEAADLAQDTFIRAMEHLHQLRKPDSFRSWLLSIARRQTLNRLERSRRMVSTDPQGSINDPALNPLLIAVDPDRLADPQQAAEIGDLAGLVWEASASLGDKDRALLELHVRQGLESAEIAEVLGVSKGNAYTMLSRLRDRAGAAIGTYLLIRRGSRRCTGLREIVSGIGVPPVTERLRKQVDRHVQSCDLCDEIRRGLIAPLEIMAAYAAVAPPPGLVDQLWGTLEMQWEVVDPPRTYRRHTRRQIAAAVGIGALVGAALLVVALLVARDDSAPSTTLPVTTSTVGDTTLPPPVEESVPVATTSTSTSVAPGESSTTAAPSTTTAVTSTTTTTPTTTSTSSTTSSTTTRPPNQAPGAEIRLPRDGAGVNVDTFDADAQLWYATVDLFADISDPDDAVGDLRVEWESTVDGFLGAGAQLTVLLSGPNCSETMHVISVTVTDPSGAAISDQISVVVRRLC